MRYICALLKMWLLTLCGVLFTLTLAASTNNEEGSKVYVLVAKKYQQGVLLTRLYRTTDEPAPDWQQVDGNNYRAGEISYFTAHNRSHAHFKKSITVCNYFGSSLITDGDDCSSLDGSATAAFSFYASDIPIPETRRITFVACFDRLANISYTLVSTQDVYCMGHNTVLRSGYFYAFNGKRFCDTPKLPVGGTITIANRTYEDEVRLVRVTYQCMVGFEMIRGYETLTCNPIGRWNRETPVCRAIACGRPIIINGVPSGGKFNFPERTSFLCKPGYVLTPPNAKIDCLATGEWEGTFGECKPVSCGPPPPVPHGRMIGFIYTYPQELTSVCDVGYENVSSFPNIKCDRRGKWIGTPARCRPITCHDPGVPTNGRRQGDDFIYGSTVRFECNEGYTLVGHGSIACGKGVWMGFKPTCQASA